MEIREFAEKLRERLLEELNDVSEIRIDTMLRNNSVTLTGLVFVKKDCKACPTIYLEEAYSSYLSGRSMDAIISDIIKAYRAARIREDVDVSFIHSWETVKPMVVYKLVNTEKNKELLSKAPHKEVLDLSMVFCIALKQYGGTIQIYNNHCDIWGVGVEELVNAARENTPQLYPVNVTTMGEIAREMGMGEISELMQPMDMCILTNENRFWGAAAMLYQDTVKRVAEQMEDDLYILPSSTHEVIVLPAKDLEADELKGMVRHANSTVVSEEDILSDSVYCYHRKTMQFDMVA